MAGKIQNLKITTDDTGRSHIFVGGDEIEFTDATLWLYSDEAPELDVRISGDITYEEAPTNVTIDSE